MYSARLGIMAVAALLFGGCSTTSVPEWQPEKRTRTFSVAQRQLPPEPVYSRLRWVRPPENIPGDQGVSDSAPAIMPVMHLEVKDTSLEEVAKILASAAQYSSYCSSLIAKQTVTISRLGTLDELGTEVQKAAQIRVIIDHGTRQIRFLADHAPTAPQLY